VSRPGYAFYDNIYKVVNPIDDNEDWYPRSATETPSYPFTLRKVDVKAMCRLSGLQWISYGNHGVKHRNGVASATGIQIYHYPVRTFAEFEKKVVNHGSSLKNNPRIPPHTGWHVRRWYDMRQQGRLQEEYETLVPDESTMRRWMDLGVVEIDHSIRNILRIANPGAGR
ncbi:MAG: hypothetical protein WB783_02570, partial [Arenicellales bacterium]